MARAAIQFRTSGDVTVVDMGLKASEYVFHGEIISLAASGNYPLAYQGTDTKCAGISQSEVASGDVIATDGAKKIKVITQGLVELPITGVAQANVGSYVYCVSSTGQTFTTTWAAGALTTGKLVSVTDTGYGWTRLDTLVTWSGGYRV